MEVLDGLSNVRDHVHHHPDGQAEFEKLPSKGPYDKFLYLHHHAFLRNESYYSMGNFWMKGKKICGIALHDLSHKLAGRRRVDTMTDSNLVR